MCFGFSGGFGPTIRPRFQGTRVLVGTVTTSGMTGFWIEELVMRNPLLPMSTASNDGSLRHKPTLASAGLDRSSRPRADICAEPVEVRMSYESGLSVFRG